MLTGETERFADPHVEEAVHVGCLEDDGRISAAAGSSDADDIAVRRNLPCIGGHDGNLDTDLHPLSEEPERVGDDLGGRDATECFGYRTRNAGEGVTRRDDARSQLLQTATVLRFELVDISPVEADMMGDTDYAHVAICESLGKDNARLA